MEHEVFIPVPAETLREALRDHARVARCVPGLQQDADESARPLSGRLKVRVGGHTITYRGTLTLTERAGAFTAKGEGSEIRGTGSARLNVRIRLRESAGGTTVAFTATAASDGRLSEIAPATSEATARRLLDRFAAALGESGGVADSGDAGAGEPEGVAGAAGQEPGASGAGGSAAGAVDADRDVTGSGATRGGKPDAAGVADSGDAGAGEPEGVAGAAGQEPGAVGAEGGAGQDVSAAGEGRPGGATGAAAGQDGDVTASGAAGGADQAPGAPGAGADSSAGQSPGEGGADRGVSAADTAGAAASGDSDDSSAGQAPGVGAGDSDDDATRAPDASGDEAGDDTDDDSDIAASGDDPDVHDLGDLDAPVPPSAFDASVEFGVTSSGEGDFLVPLDPPAEAAHARRTMIGRSAEEVDHAPPRGRYAPERAPDTGGAGAALRWVGPAAALAIAGAVVVGRALRRRR
ncbi:SRPBCC family protein [Streptomyces niveus]|uniref:SRPBCC family protein n=1 Tax=Streptomyces niveus TaxID=193462 RepID=UPI003645D8B3